MNEGAGRIEALPQDFWLERTLFTTRWPTLIEAVQVQQEGETIRFVAQVVNRKTGSRYGVRLCLGGPREILEVAPGEPVVPGRAVSPDGRYVAYVETDGHVRLVVTDQAEGTEWVVFDAPSGGEWSIGDVVWSSSSNAVYFDNKGQAACIWRYDLASGTLEKIVPAHDARSPVPYVQEGVEHLAYIDGVPGAESRLKITRKLGTQARRAFARGAATLADLPLEWVAVTKCGDAWVVETWSDTPRGRATVDPASGTLSLGFGQDTQRFGVTAATSMSEDRIALISTTPSGAYREIAEFHFLARDRSVAEITCFACQGDPAPRRYIDTGRASEYEKVGESCRE